MKDKLKKIIVEELNKKMECKGFKYHNKTILANNKDESVKIFIETIADNILSKLPDEEVIAKGKLSHIDFNINKMSVETYLEPETGTVIKVIPTTGLVGKSIQLVVRVDKK